MIGATKEFICLSNEIGNKINSRSEDQMIDCGRVCFGIIGQLRRLGRGCQTKFMGVRYGHDHSIFNLPESRHRHFRCTAFHREKTMFLCLADVFPDVVVGNIRPGILV